MKLYGLLVAQNEADIIVDTLSYLRHLNVFEKIFFFDLGSEDDTLAKAMQFTDVLHEPQRLHEVYTEGLRFDLLAKHRSFFKKSDWLAIVDADEMYAEDPRPVIEAAERENATCIPTYQAEFMLTDIDLAGIDNEDATLSICERRRHYLIQWSEVRFYKFLPGEGLLSNVRPSSRRLLNRHYQYRSPTQIDLRIRTRLANRVKARHLPSRQKWPQIFSRDWTDYVTPHQLLHYDDGGKLRFGLPQGVQWKDYYSKNPFSTVFPQVATALAAGRLVIIDAAATAPERPVSRVDDDAVRADSVLRDDFRARVVREFRINVQARRWAEAARALVVLFRHLLRWSRCTFPPVLQWCTRRATEIVEDRLLGLKRRLIGQSHGSIRAEPNPIARPHMSWQGVTTLTWTSTAKQVEVRVGAPDGRLLTRSSPSGMLTTGPWVEDATLFYLQDVSHGQPLVRAHTLAKVTVGLVRGWYVNAVDGLPHP